MCADMSQRPLRFSKIFVVSALYPTASPLLRLPATTSVPETQPTLSDDR